MFEFSLHTSKILIFSSLGMWCGVLDRKNSSVSIYRKKVESCLSCVSISIITVQVQNWDIKKFLHRKEFEYFFLFISKPTRGFYLSLNVCAYANLTVLLLLCNKGTPYPISQFGTLGFKKRNPMNNRLARYRHECLHFNQ